MKYLIIGVLIFGSLPFLQGQVDTLGRGFYIRPKTYQSGMAHVWRNYRHSLDEREGTIQMGRTSYLDTIWICCDTLIGGKSYLKLDGGHIPTYKAEVEGELWRFDNRTKEEILVIPQRPSIGFKASSENGYSQTIVGIGSQFQHFGVLFKDLIAIETIRNGYPMTCYFKKGVGFIACVQLGKVISILERNLFLQQP